MKQLVKHDLPPPPGQGLSHNLSPCPPTPTECYYGEEETDSKLKKSEEVTKDLLNQIIVCL